MTRERFELYAKTTAGNDPESWELVDEDTRRLSVRPLADLPALQAGTRYQANATHVARGGYDEEYKTGCLLKRLDDETYWYILDVRQTGRRRRGVGHSLRVRLTLSPHNWGEELP